MIDYKKLKRLFQEHEWQMIDALINVDIDLISKIDDNMIRKGFAEKDGFKYRSLLTPRELQLFNTVKMIANGHIKFLVSALSTILQDKQESNTILRLEKECEALKSVIDAKDLEVERLRKPLPDNLREQGLI